MKIKFISILKWGIIIFILFPTLLFFGNVIRIKVRMTQLEHEDHAQILSACRIIIDNRNLYLNQRDKWGTLDKNDVLLLPPFPPNIPKVILDLKPHDIIIYDSGSVNINVSLPLCRMSILAFRSDAKQFGTRKYIDGLWFWNGNK